MKSTQEKSHGKLSGWRMAMAAFESQKTPTDFEDAPVKHGTGWENPCRENTDDREMWVL